MNERELRERQVAAVIANMNAPRWLRARRRVAFFVGLTLRLRTLGYLIDYDRDRYAGASEVAPAARAARPRREVDRPT